MFFRRIITKANSVRMMEMPQTAANPHACLSNGTGTLMPQIVITSVGTAYERAAAHGVTAEAFAAKCSLSLKGLNEALKNATGTKGKALEAIADEVLRGITDTGKPTFEVVEIAALE